MATFPAKTNYAAGDILTAAQMVDIGDQINALNGCVGKNKFINGAFDFWQRGTSSTANGYLADRWQCFTDATATFSQQTFTPGAAPVSGYEGRFFLRMAKNSGGSYVDVRQYIEDVRTLAGQTVTLSFWAKCDSGTQSIEPYYTQNFGSGGSTSVNSSVTAQTITTSWARYSFTFTLPSVSGKTIGSNSFLLIYAVRSISSSSARTIDTWGIQLEAGNTATAFQTATGTLAGELAACQRYYWRNSSNGTTATQLFTLGVAYNSTSVQLGIQYPVQMRTTPTTIDAQNLAVLDVSSSRVNITSAAIDGPATNSFNASILLTGATGLTTNRVYYLFNQVSASGYLGLGAEL